jgi:hypothetical protein
MDDGSFKAMLNTEEGPALIGLLGNALPFVSMLGTLGGLFRTGTSLNGGIGQRRSEVVLKPFQKLPTRRARAVNLRRICRPIPAFRKNELLERIMAKS